MSHHHGESTGCHCLGCEDDQMARNNYFTGKLLVERDFTDEQRFFLGKLQRHNHYLHGSGVVCGLEVVQHWNPECRNTYVIIRPGYAIDCCGHEIIVPDELGGRNGEHGVLFNFAEAPAVKKLREEVPPKPHILEFCIRYKECGTEDIPVLYDECGCDDTRCAPNRILESYAIEVHVLEIESRQEGGEPHDTGGRLPVDPETPPARTQPGFETSGPSLGSHPGVTGPNEPTNPETSGPETGPPTYTRVYCERLLWYSIQKCRSCETPDCITLAIARRFQTGFALWNPPTRPDTSVNDMEKRISRIDNWSRRPILPSTRVLTDVIRCILRRCCPGSGTEQPTALTHISSISWTHNGDTRLGEIATPQEYRDHGLGIAFDGEVLNGDLHLRSVVLEAQTVENGRICWCQVPSVAIGGTFADPQNARNGFTPAPTLPGSAPNNRIFDPNARVNGVRVYARFEAKQFYRVLIKGDFIRDMNGRGLDANHLPPWLPAARSGDGVAGGLFESWFRVVDRDQVETPPVDVNNGTREQLIKSGASSELADRIIRERSTREFKNLAEFRRRMKLSAAETKKLRVTIE